MVRRLWLGFAISLLSGCWSAPSPVASPPKAPKAEAVPPAAEAIQNASLALPDLRRRGVVNGIDSGEAVDFWNRWKLVTARYRPDNDEQRFVFANAIAWKAIQEKAKVYPPGAMFGKIGFSTAHDPSFPVSLAPADFQRVQLMKKMPKGYQDTKGWAYALYLRGKTPFAKAEIEACHACHTLVPDRDYVFSKPAFLTVDTAPPMFVLRDKFERKKPSELDPQMAEILGTLVPKLSSALYVFSLPLFYGSLNEAIGPLSAFASQNKLPYLLVDSKVKQRFIFALPASADETCTKQVAVFHSLGQEGEEPSENPAAPKDYIEITKGISCNGVFEWESTPIVYPLSKKSAQSPEPKSGARG